MVEGAGDPSGHAAGAALAEAEDRIARAATPIRGDLSAWMAFLAAYEADPAPACRTYRDWLAAHANG